MAAPEPGDDPGLAAGAAYADSVAGVAPQQVFSPRKAAVDQVRLYALDNPPAWHLVTLGLADLGFELTLRLPRGEDELPTWGADLLISLAAYARRSGHGFAEGHHVDLRGPVKLGAETAITAAAVTVDPALGALGQVEFLQLVGLTGDELELCRSWRTDAVVSLLRQRDPMLTTVLDRSSLLDDPAFRDIAEAGVAADGSALDELRVASLSWRWRGVGPRRLLVVTLGAGAATALGPALRRKLDHPGATFSVIGDAGQVCFALGADDGWRLDGETVAIEVSPASLESLAGLFTGQTGTGSLAWLSGLRFTVIT
jgi:hypothetical protein